nr:unnamed protein product [Spirometra erinaceieuropaei]
MQTGSAWIALISILPCARTDNFNGIQNDTDRMNVTFSVCVIHDSVFDAKRWNLLSLLQQYAGKIGRALDVANRQKTSNMPQMSSNPRHDISFTVADISSSRAALLRLQQFNLTISLTACGNALHVGEYTGRYGIPHVHLTNFACPYQPDGQVSFIDNNTLWLTYPASYEDKFLHSYFHRESGTDAVHLMQENQLHDVILDSWNHRKPTDPRGGIPVVTFRRNTSRDNGPQNRRSTAFDLDHVFTVWMAHKIPQTVFLHTMSPDVEDIVAQAYNAGLISQNTFWTILDEAGSNMNVSGLTTKLNASDDASTNPIKDRQRARPNLAFIRRYPVLRNEDCFDTKLPLDFRARMRRLFDCRVDHIPWYNETGLLNSLWMFASNTRRLHEPITFYRTAQLQADGSLEMTDFAAFQAPQSDISGLFPNAFYSFFGEKLRIGCLQARGFVEDGSLDENGFLQNASGFQIDLLQLLQEQFQFGFELVTPADGEYGRKLPNGSWTGLIGLVVRGEVEFAVGPITISAERAKAIQFMEHFQSAHLAVFYRTPAESSNLVRMATPFHWQTWTLIIASIFLTSGLICCLSRCSPFSAWNLRLLGAVSDEVSLWDNLWNTFEAFVMQGEVFLESDFIKAKACFDANFLNPPSGHAYSAAQEFYPLAYSSRILMASWWMYVVLLQAAYQAELVAFLSSSEVIPPFETLEELADDTAIVPLVARGSYAASIMEKAGPESTYGRLWKRTITVSEAEGMEKILASPEFVYIDDEVTAGGSNKPSHEKRLS